AKMKDGVKIINLARADLVNVPDMKAALDSGKVSAYVTDFPTNETLTDDRIIAIPHLGASTEEAEDNCAVMAARQLDDFLQNGNIVNSVNFPAVSMPRSGEARICVFHANVPAVLSSITAEMGKRGINIENMTNKSKASAAYTMLDVAAMPDDAAVEAIATIEGVFRVKIV
ncbi:MAG: 3-phosphoglycerate dehydrogenase, partial [Clostridia bacterium]|nr:3-phosphoglycerate dehydrogenase [Clostridia bacterium]